MKTSRLELIVKFILIPLLLICLAPMPYGYYQFVRFFAFMAFAFLAFKVQSRSNETFTFIYIGLAILFQPFFKIALGRELWNIVDVIVAIGLGFTIWKKSDI